MINQNKNIINKIELFNWIGKCIESGAVQLDDLKDHGIRVSQAGFLELSGKYTIENKEYSFSKTYPNTLSQNLPLRTLVNECVEDLKEIIGKTINKKKNKKSVSQENASLKENNAKLVKRNEALAAQLVEQSSQMERLRSDLKHYREDNDRLRQRLNTLEGSGGHLRPVN